MYYNNEKTNVFIWAVNTNVLCSMFYGSYIIIIIKMSFLLVPPIPAPTGTTSEFIYQILLSTIPDWSVALFVFKSSTGVSFAGFCRGQPMTGDQCMADRGQIDLTYVSLSLSNARCLSHLAWRTRGWGLLCVHSVHTWLYEDGRLRLIDCTELSVTGQRGEKKTGRRRRRDAFWWCPCETNN